MPQTKPTFKITCCIPCYGRPSRTLRAAECVLGQDMNGWEAYFIGDGCPVFERMLDDGVFNIFVEEAEKRGNEMVFANLKEHHGGWGYAARNVAFEHARGKFFLFYDNDDVIKPNHFSHYLSEIENSGYDMVYYDSYIEPINEVRKSHLSFGNIGHSEIIVRTEALKGYKQKPHYGQDWDLIETLTRKGFVAKKGLSKETTYVIKEIGGSDPGRERLYEKDID